MRKSRRPMNFLEFARDTFLDAVDSMSTPEILFGTYSDGTSRSFIDAIKGDYISPKKKAKLLSKKESKKKLKKKAKKIEKEKKKLKKITKKMMNKRK